MRVTAPWCLLGAVWWANSFSPSRAFSHVQSKAIFFRCLSLEDKTSLCFASSSTTEEELEQLREKKSQELRTSIFSQLPPWLESYSDITQDQADEEVRWLEYALLEQGFPIDDIQNIVTDICRVSKGDQAIKLGIVDFLKIVLALNDGLGLEGGSAYFATTPVLRACILHYSDCALAQRQGIPRLLQKFLRQPASTSQSNLALPPATAASEGGLLAATSPDVTVLPTSSLLAPSLVPAMFSSSWINDNNEEIQRIAKGAAKLKRAELLLQAIHKEAVVSSPEKVRDLLLSVMDDWRSLGIRAVACLYRLEGLSETADGTGEFLDRTPQVVHTAREALRIYAPLAQRLGLQSLKARLESNAFRILYRRQYNAAASIFREGGDAMHALSSYLLSNINCLLREDEALMSQLQDLRVVSRVKEPYSFWRKLLTKRLKGALSPSSNNSNETSRSSLSVAQVQDGVALRVIITASKLRPDETVEDVRARENLLCYYVQQLIRQRWPETDPSRLKDYIANPKPNGYQSLHHTSMISSRGLEFPFEVQVRTDDMHQLAEFGYAAHWDYKLDSQNHLLKDASQSIAQEVMSTKDCLTVSEQQSNPYISALVGAKESLIRQQVYVFVIGFGENASGSGELVSVPANSPIQYVIDEIEAVVKSTEVQVWKNGRLAGPYDNLDNGDVVLIAI